MERAMLLVTVYIYTRPISSLGNGMSLQAFLKLEIQEAKSGKEIIRANGFLDPKIDFKHVNQQDRP